MAKTRSPNYPSLDLGAALEAVRPVFEAENRNKFSRFVLAQHLGYSGLNGRALGKIGAVRAYGLIEGSGDDLRLSEDAISALMAPEGSLERQSSLERSAMQPPLFIELNQEFKGLPSENNLRFWLIKRHFTPEAAGRAAVNYLETMRLVGRLKGESDALPSEEIVETQPALADMKSTSLSWMKGPATRPGVLQEVFNLQEGPVTLIFPASLSAESFRDLSDHLELFLRKAKRRAFKDGDYESN